MTQETIPLKQNEEIKPIEGYEGIYSITSFGRVWSHVRVDRLGRKWGGKFLNLKCKLNKKRTYFNICLSKDNKIITYQIHRLVAQAYIPNPQNLPEVNHKDGNKLNNFAGTKEKNYEDSNLEWCTSQVNHNHALIMNLKYKETSEYYGIYKNKGRRNRSKPWVVGVKICKEYNYIGSFRTEIEAAQVYNDYVIEHNLNRPLNKINIKEYIREVKISEDLARKKIRGVSLYKGKKYRNKPWQSYICINRKQIYIGSFKTELEAVKAYNDYVIEHNLNKPLNLIGG